MKKWLFLFIILVFQSCSQKVISYINYDAQFEKFESFRIVSVKLDGRKVTPESTQLFEDIKIQIVDQMMARSYVQSNIAPDLTIRYELSSTNRSVEQNNTDSFGNVIGYPNLSSRTIHEAILLLELYDSKKKLVWQGSYDLKQEKKEQKAFKALQNAIQEIFTTYPYKAGSKNVHQELTSTKKKKND